VIAILSNSIPYETLTERVRRLSAVFAGEFSELTATERPARMSVSRNTAGDEAEI